MHQRTGSIQSGDKLRSKDNKRQRQHNSCSVGSHMWWSSIIHAQLLLSVASNCHSGLKFWQSGPTGSSKQEHCGENKEQESWPNGSHFSTGRKKNQGSYVLTQPSEKILCILHLGQSSIHGRQDKTSWTLEIHITLPSFPSLRPHSNSHSNFFVMSFASDPDAQGTFWHKPSLDVQWVFLVSVVEALSLPFNISNRCAEASMSNPDAQGLRQLWLRFGTKSRVRLVLFVRQTSLG